MSEDNSFFDAFIEGISPTPFNDSPNMSPCEFQLPQESSQDSWNSSTTCGNSMNGSLDSQLSGSTLHSLPDVSSHDYNAFLHGQLPQPEYGFSGGYEEYRVYKSFALSFSPEHSSLGYGSRPSDSMSSLVCSLQDLSPSSTTGPLFAPSLFEIDINRMKELAKSGKLGSSTDDDVSMDVFNTLTAQRLEDQSSPEYVAEFTEKEPPPLGPKRNDLSNSLSKTSNRRQRKRQVLTLQQQQENLERHRKRNRVAATRCRIKQNEWTRKLESKVRTLDEIRQALTTTVNFLKGEILSVEEEILRHTDCGGGSEIKEYLNHKVERLSRQQPGSRPGSEPGRTQKTFVQRR